MSEWSNMSFGGLELNETSFNEQVGGSRYMSIGTHENVKITSIEPKKSKAGNDMIKVTFENGEGQTFSPTILISYVDKKTGKQVLHWNYVGLCGAIASSDVDTQLKFFVEAVPRNPSLLGALNGMVVSMTIVKGDSGVEVLSADPQGKVLRDVVTGLKPEGTDDVYADFKSANEAIKEFNLSKCWDSLGKFSEPSEENQTTNVAAIKKILTNGLQPTRPTIASL